MKLDMGQKIFDVKTFFFVGMGIDALILTCIY